MSSKTEDFPTPISPTRRMVYSAFVSFFDVLIFPFLRDSTSLKNTVKTAVLRIHCNQLDSRGVIPVSITGATRGG